MNFNIDEKLFEEANQVFKNIGLDINTAVEIFLKKSILENDLPFNVDENTMSYSPESPTGNDFADYEAMIYDLTYKK